MSSKRSSKVSSSGGASGNLAGENHLKHKRRYCRHEGCNRIVKSQGLCQRHGAKPRTCKIEGCDKQAQGNFDRMCKAHFKAMKRATTPLPKVVPGKVPPAPEGNSVYDYVLPASITFTNRKGAVMPLIAHLKAGFDEQKPPAWHRNEERRARGIHPVENPATQLEGWERELVWMEILVLTGAPGASFRHLARAWGRDKGFHMVLAQFICERQGDVQRKKRMDKEAEGKSRGPAKKRRRLRKNKTDSEVSADIWDDSAYGDVITNEALAAGIFDFSPQEFESATALHRWKHMEEANSDTASLTSQRSAHQTAATQAILGEGGTILPKAAQKPGDPRLAHPEDYPETSTLAPAAEGNGSEQHHFIETRESADPNQHYPNVGDAHSHGHYNQNVHQQHYQGNQSEHVQHHYPDVNVQVENHGQQYHQTVTHQPTFQQTQQYQADPNQQHYGHNMIHQPPAPTATAQHQNQFSPTPAVNHFIQPVQGSEMVNSQNQQHYYQGGSNTQLPAPFESSQTQSQYASAPEEYDSQVTTRHDDSNLHHHHQYFDHGDQTHTFQHTQYTDQAQNQAHEEHHQQRDHPEQNPETSALPPELGHHSAHYPDQTHQGHQENQGY